MPFLQIPNPVQDTIVSLTNALLQVTVAGYTAGQRAKQVPRGKYIACVSILVGTAITVLLPVLLSVFPFTPRYIIPVAGMMVGNAMTVTGVTMKKLREDVKIQRNLVSHLSSSDLRWLLNCLYSPCRFLLGSARTRHESQKLLHQKQSTHSAHIFFSSCLSNSSKF
jgi:hypothetical protein